jgi:hypothetical protein
MFPIASYKGRYYQVRLATGELGLVSLEDIKEASELYALDTVTTLKIEERGQEDHDHLILSGEAVSLLDVTEKSLLKILLKDGAVRYTYTSRFRANFHDSLPEIRQLRLRIYDHEKLINKLNGLSPWQLEEELDLPMGLWLDPDKDSSGFAFYEDVLVVENEKRSRYLWLYFKNNAIVKDSISKGFKVFVERMPLAP